MKLHASDIEVTSYSNSSPWIAMDIVHKPTGITKRGVTSREQPSRMHLKIKLMEELVTEVTLLYFNREETLIEKNLE